MAAKNVDPKNAQLRIDSSNVSTLYLAEILGITSDAVTRLSRAGVIRQNGQARGKYNLYDAVPAYLDHLRKGKGSDVAIRLTLERARKLEIENDRRESELVKTSQAVEVLRAASRHWKSIADGVPKRIAPRLAKIKNPVEVGKVLRDELDGIYWEWEKGLKNLKQGTSNESENKVLPVPRGVAPPAR